MGFSESLNAYCDIQAALRRGSDRNKGYWFLYGPSQWGDKPRLRYRYRWHDGRAAG